VPLKFFFLSIWDRQTDHVDRATLRSLWECCPQTTKKKKDKDLIFMMSLELEGLMA